MRTGHVTNCAKSSLWYESGKVRLEKAVSETDKELNLIREYLLGRLAETPRDTLEERFLSDRQLVQTVAVVEAGLIDDYARGLLPGEERQAFEEFFLSTPERMEKLSFARALSDYARGAVRNEGRSLQEPVRESFRTGFWRAHYRAIWTTAIASLIVIAAGGSLLLRSEWQARRDAAALRSELAVLNPPGEPRQDIPDKIGPLQAGIVRGTGGSEGYAISADGAAVQLRFEVPPDDIAAYQVRKESGQAITIFELQHLKPIYVSGEKLILVNLPAQILQPGSHYFRVSGNSDSGELKEMGVYYLKIVR